MKNKGLSNKWLKWQYHLPWTSSYKTLFGEEQSLSFSHENNPKQQGSIIEWPLNWKFNNLRDIILTSQLFVSNLTLTVVVKKMLEMLFYIKILREIINYNQK